MIMSDGFILVKIKILIPSDQISHSVKSDSLRPHVLQHARLPCPSPSPGAYTTSCPLSQWYQFKLFLINSFIWFINHLILINPVNPIVCFIFLVKRIIHYISVTSILLFSSNLGKKRVEYDNFNGAPIAKMSIGKEAAFI